MGKSKLTFTVGITTCYGDDSIIETVKSIRAQKGINKFRFILIADRVPIKPEIKKALKKYKVELIENATEGSQVIKQKQILDLTNSEVLILTQDDVIFRPYTFAKILRAFDADNNLTMVSVRNHHLDPISFFEDVLNVGTRIANNIAANWKGGDNYIAHVGRCMAFRTEFLKSHFSIPESIATTDAYYYFSNKFAGGKFRYLPDSAVYFRNPQNMKEHLRKSSRFQYSQFEMSHFFGNLKEEYGVPKSLAIASVYKEFKDNPVTTCAYFIVRLYTRIKRLQPKSVLNPIWEVDISTKQI